MEPNPIIFLQEYMQVYRRCTPKYDLIDSKCGTHQNYFKFKVQCGQDSANGEGSSKKDARTKAAEALIQLLDIRPSARSDTTSTNNAVNINYVGKLQVLQFQFSIQKLLLKLKIIL